MTEKETQARSAAFPQQVELEHGTTVNAGLSKREYFAGLAMQGLLSRPPVNPNGWVDGDTYARTAISCADALITELNRPSDE